MSWPSFLRNLHCILCTSHRLCYSLSCCAEMPLHAAECVRGSLSFLLRISPEIPLEKVLLLLCHKVVICDTQTEKGIKLVIAKCKAETQTTHAASSSSPRHPVPSSPPTASHTALGLVLMTFLPFFVV